MAPVDRFYCSLLSSAKYIWITRKDWSVLEFQPLKRTYRIFTTGNMIYHLAACYPLSQFLTNMEGILYI